jgi:hypothetical protein
MPGTAGSNYAGRGPYSYLTTPMFHFQFQLPFQLQLQGWPACYLGAPYKYKYKYQYVSTYSKELLLLPV